MVKQAVRTGRQREAATIARRALCARSADDVRALLAPMAEAMRAASRTKENSNVGRDASGETVGLRAPLGEDGSVRGQAHPRQSRPRTQPAVPQQKDETIFLWSGKMLFEIEVNGTLTKREMHAGRSRARDAEDGASHDGDRGLATSSKCRRPSFTTSSASRIATAAQTSNGARGL